MVRTKKVVEGEGDVNASEKEAKLVVYEVGYLMVPTIAEENLGGEVTSFKDMFTENGAVFISDEYPKLIELAYEMSRSIENKKQKFSYGYFGWVKFECRGEQAKVIKSILDKNEKLIRFLMIKTVRENTMSVKRSYSKQDGYKRQHTQKTKEADPINEETIDKEIDALVV
ncbi:MAG TPA: 30S ribosomal protein S6 [Candidatus Paceibacterota bacterium]|nr:30S ribosomal protein S6 [Candidatus Paceibacterota bacterium]